jgi:hypothetical protein
MGPPACWDLRRGLSGDTSCRPCVDPVQQEEIEQLHAQLTVLTTELTSLPERIGRSSRNSY